MATDAHAWTWVQVHGSGLSRRRRRIVGLGATLQGPDESPQILAVQAKYATAWCVEHGHCTGPTKDERRLKAAGEFGVTGTAFGRDGDAAFFCAREHADVQRHLAVCRDGAFNEAAGTGFRQCDPVASDGLALTDF